MPKTMAITGANTGMGKATAMHLAKKGYHILMLTRSISRGQTAAEDIIKASGNDKVEVINCDLASLSSIARCVEQLKERIAHLDVLINNAGVLPLKREETEDGFERQLGVNHLGHFALSCRLFDLFVAAKQPRVVNVASGAYKIGRMHWDDPHLNQKYGMWKAYAQSKWANILFTMELADRLQPIGGVAFSVHPGAVSTEIGVNRKTGFGRSLHRILRPFFLTPEQGAATTITLADGDVPMNLSGQYFYKQKPVPIINRRKGQIKEEAKKLWEWSEQQTKVCWPLA